MDRLDDQLQTGLVWFYSIRKMDSLFELNYIDQYKYSMNPFIKNCKTGFHDDILNRTSHYCKLLLSRTTIDNRFDNKYGYLLEQKGQKQKERRRLQSNEELMKSLIDIDRRSGTYRAFSQEQVPRKKSLKNRYLQRQKSLAISEENIRLYHKILTQETDYSPQKIKEFDAQITRYSKIIRHPHQEVCEMDREFYRTYRYQLLKANVALPKRNTMDCPQKLQEMLGHRGRKNRKLKKIVRDLRCGALLQENPQ